MCIKLIIFLYFLPITVSLTPYHDLSVNPVIFLVGRGLRKRASTAVADFLNTVRDNARRRQPVSNLFMQARSHFISATRGIYQAHGPGAHTPVPVPCTPRRSLSPSRTAISLVPRRRAFPRNPKTAEDPSRNVASSQWTMGGSRIILRHNITWPPYFSGTF